MLNIERGTTIYIKREGVTARVTTTDPFYMGLFELFQTRYPDLCVFTGDFSFHGLVIGKCYEVPKQTLRFYFEKTIPERAKKTFIEEHETRQSKPMPEAADTKE